MMLFIFEYIFSLMLHCCKLGILEYYTFFGTQFLRLKSCLCQRNDNLQVCSTAKRLPEKPEAWAGERGDVVIVMAIIIIPAAIPAVFLIVHHW